MTGRLERLNDGVARHVTMLEREVCGEAARVLNYVADMTYCGADAEWHFKPGYDPQRVLDVLK
jgi:hypothetical protein